MPNRVPEVSRAALAALLPACLLLAGCGGPDLGAGVRSNSFDQGLQGNYSGAGGGFNRGGINPGSATRARGTYAKLEGSFELTELQGNPFDLSENDVTVFLGTPDNRTMRVPAFFDGDKTWRFRFTPEVSGRFTLQKVQNNGRDVTPDKVDRKDFDVNGSAGPGFVRRDPKDKTRFAFDNGNSYYPIGFNVAWGKKPSESALSAVPVALKENPPAAPQTPAPSAPAAAAVTEKNDGGAKPDAASTKPTADAAPAAAALAADYAETFGKMGKAGINWSRVWMTHWDGKNLDWTPGRQTPLGHLDLAAARRWDGIVDAAEKNSLRFQMVLHHHGQLSTRVDAAWDGHPWNKKNGGFLNSADEFFTNPRAIALTKNKLRYIIARWGYSPSILAWELFNEVENTDSAYHKHQDEIAAWHDAMAAFIRQQDPYKHLITSSSGADAALVGRELDFYQPHGYPSDALATVTDLDLRKADRPLFFGELRPAGDEDARAFLRTSLWGSLMSESGGAAQFWSWETVEKKDLYDEFKAAAEFVRQSGLLSKKGLMFTAPTVETAERGPLTIAPGAGWAAAKQTEFTILPSGLVDGLGAMPAYLQGSSDRALFPSATFKATYAAPGTFTVRLGKVAKGGAKVTLSADGVVVAEKEFPAGAKEATVDAVLETKVEVGAHTFKLENSGAGWATIRNITLTPFAPTAGAAAKASKDYAALWVYHRAARGAGKPAESPLKAKVTVPGLKEGGYKVTWWDPSASKVLAENTGTATAAGLTVETPEFRQDLAAYVTRSNEKTASARTTKPKKDEPKKDPPKKAEATK